MKIVTDTARTARNAVEFYFQPIRKHPVLCVASGVALGAILAAFECGMEGSSSVEPSRNSTPASAEQPVVLPNLDSFSPKGEGNRQSD